RFVRYERGLRYSHQRVKAVRVGPCECGGPATGLADAGQGLVGWRCLMPRCVACAAHRNLVTFGSFARRLGGLVPVTPDEGAAGWPGPVTGAPARPGASAAGRPADAEAVAALGHTSLLVATWASVCFSSPLALAASAAMMGRTAGTAVM